MKKATILKGLKPKEMYYKTDKGIKLNTILQNSKELKVLTKYSMKLVDALNNEIEDVCKDDEDKFFEFR